MLSYLNIKNANYIRNASVDMLIDNAVESNEGVIGHNGALMVETGEFSGRIPKDKFIVQEDSSVIPLHTEQNLIFVFISITD